jgi:TM2 domain-containing membrane protein YozV
MSPVCRRRRERASRNIRRAAAVQSAGEPPGAAEQAIKETNVNINKRQTAFLGVFLIGLAIVAWLNLWWLIFPLILAAGGVVGYVVRRAIGRTSEAVQVGIWGVGLALLALTGFWFPGILLLAGASLLARGREERIDAAVQGNLGRVRARGSARAITIQRVPVTPPTPPAPAEPPATGETTRL